MDSEVSVSDAPVKHEFFVTLKGGVVGKLTISAKPSGEVVSVVNGILLSVFDQSNTRAVSDEPSTRVDQIAGIRRVHNEDGTITSVPSEKVKADIRLFAPTSPCWFPECEALRAAYTKELEALPAGCPECEKGALIRKYLKKMETINTDPS